MNKKNPIYRNMAILLVIFLIFVSIAEIMLNQSRDQISTKKPCVKLEEGSWLQQPSQQNNAQDHFDCLPDQNKELYTLFILGLVNIDELSMWVLGVDRRLIVLKMMHEKRLIKASDIADNTDRSLQNISYAIRELEKQGLIKCLTPEKHTWKKFILTEKGIEVIEKLKNDHLID